MSNSRIESQYSGWLFPWELELRDIKFEFKNLRQKPTYLTVRLLRGAEALRSFIAKIVYLCRVCNNR